MWHRYRQRYYRHLFWFSISLHALGATRAPRLVPADPAKPALGPSNGGWSNPRTLPYGVWITGADLHMLSLYNSMLSTRRFVWLREFTNPRTEFTNPRTAHRAPVAPTPAIAHHPPHVLLSIFLCGFWSYYQNCTKQSHHLRMPRLLSVWYSTPRLVSILGNLVRTPSRHFCYYFLDTFLIFQKSCETWRKCFNSENVVRQHIV
jgi:hypothetical protein